MIPALSEALAERGFDTLTPVQQAVIAPEIADADLLVSAQTGSGKTVGFGLAIANTLLGDAPTFGPAAEPLALVVAPTRELAFQVKGELAWLYARTGAVVASCVGGMDARQERRALDRGAHIVVGTPGRLRDHIERGALVLGGIRAVVLDEADEMLDLGFRDDLEFILDAAPAERRTLMFSATVPPMIVTLAQRYQRDAQRINTQGQARQHADIAYQVLRVAASDGEHAIFNLLRLHHDDSAIVFANTRAAVSHLTARLANRGFATVSLSGELSQTERTHALQAMRDGRARVCVATDVAARGIDLPNLSLVIHADLPMNTESLLHRSGRTGRAGRKGISALIVPPKAVGKAERLLKWAKITAEWTLPPSAEDIQRADEGRLLDDPAWDETPTDEQVAFARELLARQSAEAVAAAYLRLYQSRHAAPEDLLPPDARPASKAKREFGPSRWISLSVGRQDRAEPRWILPMLCRAGRLDKQAIGAIRVQDTETFVEIGSAHVDSFIAGLGDGARLEDEIRVRLLEEPPALSGPAGSERTGRGHVPTRPAAPVRKQDDSPPKRRTGTEAAAPQASAEGAPSAPPKSVRQNAKPRAADKPAKPARKPHRKGQAPAAKTAKAPGGKPAKAPGGPKRAKTQRKTGRPKVGGAEPPRRGKS